LLILSKVTVSLFFADIFPIKLRLGPWSIRIFIAIIYLTGARFPII
jgi:hypothetical protein